MGFPDAVRLMDISRIMSYAYYCNKKYIYSKKKGKTVLDIIHYYYISTIADRSDWHFLVCAVLRFPCHSHKIHWSLQNAELLWLNSYIAFWCASQSCSTEKHYFDILQTIQFRLYFLWKILYMVENNTSSSPPPLIHLLFVAFYWKPNALLADHVNVCNRLQFGRKQSEALLHCSEKWLGI